MATTTKKTTTKKPAIPRKPRVQKAVKPEIEESVSQASEHQATAQAHVESKHEEVKAAKGKYFYAVGRRKTSVANVRLFFGKAKSQVNNRDLAQYFGGFVDEVTKPLQLTGLENQVYVYANIKGGGVHSQAGALAHGIARAVMLASPDHRKVLKKNSMLTRDSRRKERKKPGLKRARRGPQWAKR